jgi:hypothetical protein
MNSDYKDQSFFKIFQSHRLSQSFFPVSDLVRQGQRNVDPKKELSLFF